MIDKLTATPLHEDDYARCIGQRLKGDDIKEGAVANLMIRVPGETYQSPVIVERKVGNSGLTLCFLDDDLLPTGVVASGEMMSGEWYPVPPIPCGKSKVEVIDRGYVLPYEADSFIQEVDDLVREANS